MTQTNNNGKILRGVVKVDKTKQEMIKNMKSKIIKTGVILLSIILLYLPLSVFYPQYFIIGGVQSGIKIELKEFSIINPKYISYSLDNSNNQYEVMFLELNRNWNLLWKNNNIKSSYAFLPKTDLEQFKNELNQSPKLLPSEIISKSKVLIDDKLKINETDSKEDIDYKQSFNPPSRANSMQYNLDNFKKLKVGDRYNDYMEKIGRGDFGLGPDKFYPDGYRLEYTIGSPKVQFAFITFKEGYPDIDEESKTTFGLKDIGFVTQRQEKIIVPANPDGTYNWEAVKDKID